MNRKERSSQGGGRRAHVTSIAKRKADNSALKKRGAPKGDEERGGNGRMAWKAFEATETAKFDANSSEANLETTIIVK